MQPVSLGDFRRIQYQPEGKEWHLRFVGHIDDLIDLERQLAFTLALLNPVVYNRGIEDELDLWLDWNTDIAGSLLELPLVDVTIDINERFSSDAT